MRIKGFLFKWYRWACGRSVYSSGIWQHPTDPKQLFHLRARCAEVAERVTGPVFLEIGSLFGESAKVMSQFGKVICVDSWEFGMQRFLDNTEGLNVIPMRGRSESVLSLFGNSRFDLIYMDGDHRFDAVCLDLREARRLVKSGGIICGDDLEKQIPELNEAEKECLKLVNVDFAGNFHPGVTRAVAEQFGRVNCEDGFWWLGT